MLDNLYVVDTSSRPTIPDSTLSEKVDEGYLNWSFSPMKTIKSWFRFFPEKDDPHETF